MAGRPFRLNCQSRAAWQQGCLQAEMNVALSVGVSRSMALPYLIKTVSRSGLDSVVALPVAEERAGHVGEASPAKQKLVGMPAAAGVDVHVAARNGGGCIAGVFG